jgi:Lipocalin-like domain
VSRENKDRNGPSDGGTSNALGKAGGRSLLGSWRLISWEEREAGCDVQFPLGPNPIGQISYDASGRMSAQLMRPNQTPFASEDWREATVEEKSAAWSNYFGYFGTYTIDEINSTVVHHIEGSWFPSLVGTDQIRHFRFEGEQIILDADTQWGGVRIVWERITARCEGKSNSGRALPAEIDSNA